MAEACVFASDLMLFEGLVWKLMNLQISAQSPTSSTWHDWYEGFKEQQTTVWSAISKARASLRASSIHPETQQRAAEQILQTSRCKNGSLKCQSLIHSIWTAPRDSSLSAMPQNGLERKKGTLHYKAGSSEDQERMSSRTTTRKTKQLLVCFQCCPRALFFKRIMRWFTWLASSLKL